MVWVAFGTPVGTAIFLRTSIASVDQHVIYLICCSTIRWCPRVFMNFSVLEYWATNHTFATHCHWLLCAGCADQLCPWMPPHSPLLHLSVPLLGANHCVGYVAITSPSLSYNSSPDWSAASSAGTYTEIMVLSHYFEFSLTRPILSDTPWNSSTASLICLLRKNLTPSLCPPSVLPLHIKSTPVLNLHLTSSGPLDLQGPPLFSSLSTSAVVPGLYIDLTFHVPNLRAFLHENVFVFSRSL